MPHGSKSLALVLGAGPMTAVLDPRLRAHLLIQTDPGAAFVVRDYLERVPGVTDASSTTGAFDAVVQVAVPDELGLQRVLVASRNAPGLSRLCLCRCPLR